MRIVFLDVTCPKPYDTLTLKNEALGGSEASLVRWAEGLAARGHDVIVAQHNRSAPGEGAAKYVPFEALDGIVGSPHVCVAYRTPELIPFIRDKWGRDPKLFLLCSDFCQDQIVQAYPVLEDTGLKILGVSRTHKQVLADALLSQIREVRGVTVGFVYNPVDLEPDTTAFDPHKLVYFSSPQKGLKRTLEIYKLLRRKDPRFKLHIANPGYLPSDRVEMKGVKNLGTLPHHEVIQHVRESLCVLHINDCFPETFGLVHAEALAVGTPVLTARHGANAEIIREPSMMIDPRDTDGIIERVFAWRDGARPKTCGNPEFKSQAVITQMEALFK